MIAACIIDGVLAISIALPTTSIPVQVVDTSNDQTSSLRINAAAAEVNDNEIDDLFVKWNSALAAGVPEAVRHVAKLLERFCNCL